MNATTRADHPTFVSTLERPRERRSISGWTLVAIGGLALALLAMAVQPSYPSDLGSAEVPALVD